MNKKLREILQDLEAKQAAAKSYMEANDIEKANQAMDEFDALQKRYDAEKRLADLSLESINPDEAKPITTPKDALDPITAFGKAAKSFFITKDADIMNRTTNADGGYTVPEDISTKINELREAKASLLDLVTVEKVGTQSGARTYKTRAQVTGFSEVSETGTISDLTAPKFSRIAFSIKKYAGYLPVTNELLEDSDANIAQVIMRWFAEESRVTANKLILGKVQSAEEVKLGGLDDIKKTLNLTLGQAFKNSSKIITNDDGLNYLDTLKDSDGDYVLSPTPADPMKMVLAAGANTIPVVVLPNADMPSEVEGYIKTTDAKVDSSKTYYTLSGSTYSAVSTPSASALDTYYEKGTKIPFIIGDLKEAIRYYDRAQRSITVSATASIGTFNAFAQDLTLYRGIEREDVQIIDPAAFVNGVILG